MRVLGIDPGSQYLGLGCVESRGTSFRWVGHQVVRVIPHGDRALDSRLRIIHAGVREFLDLWRPEAVAVEEVFFAKNAQSALKLGQARGAALVEAATRGLPIFEYPATLVKQTVTGSGRAEKTQVERMVRAILGASIQAAFERADASDALAVAICHLQHRHKHELLAPRGGEKRLGPSLG
jgi:crossover junction endodeoxyribonuclease RuvC